MTPLLPEVEDFRRRILALKEDPLITPHLRGRDISLGELTLEDVARLLADETAYYFLIAAANLNRTAVRAAMKEPEAALVSPKLRRAYAIRARLPLHEDFAQVATKAVALRSADVSRKSRGAIEQLLKERLRQEGIPLLMSPPIRQVPGLLIGKRKPDGVYPDPAEGAAPLVYLEIKNVRRVADDIQKRLYEIAEASIEMKAIYGDLQLTGLNVTSTAGVEANPELRARLRSQITRSLPVAVAVLLCPGSEAERYRKGAEVFVDRVFFQEEVEDCLNFLRETIRRLGSG